MIDGVDISTIGLTDLRSRLTIIPRRSSFSNNYSSLTPLQRILLS